MPAAYQPLVSIVTPTFNAGPYVEQAINSIMAQRYKNWEHIIVDGGSDDGTLSILRKYDWQDNFRWTSQPDRGVYDAINKGLKASRGQIQCFLPADDLYLPWTLETVVGAFERERTSDIAYGDGMITAMDKPYGIISFNPPSRSLEAFCAIATPNTNPFFWKRHVFEQLGGYDLRFKIASDYDFLAKASRIFRSSKVNEVLSIWRYRPDSVTGNRRLAFDEYLRISSKMRKLRSEKGGSLLWRARRTKNFVEYSYTQLLRLSLRDFMGVQRGDWSNLINSGAISKPRLVHELLTSLIPGLLGRSLGSNFLSGYVDTQGLLRMANSGIRAFGK